MNIKDGGQMESKYKVLERNNDYAKRKDYWEIAKGLQESDYLKTSEYLETVIKDTVAGKYDTLEAVKRVDSYYDSESSDAGTAEADKSAARITAALENSAFKFSPVTLRVLHKQIFDGVFPDEWVGVYRSVNLTKEEPVLCGRSVQYADWSMIEDTLRYDFDEQARVRYHLPFDSDQVSKLVRFTSNIWQTHPFREGNTRTVATFTIMRLQSMGVDIDNTPFKENAQYFRDALVRANYASLRDGIDEDDSFLTMFFENVLTGANHDLSAIDLRCPELYKMKNREQQLRDASKAYNDEHPHEPTDRGEER